MIFFLTEIFLIGFINWAWQYSLDIDDSVFHGIFGGDLQTLLYNTFNLCCEEKRKLEWLGQVLQTSKLP